jgi:hypothetical protein
LLSHTANCRYPPDRDIYNSLSMKANLKEKDRMQTIDLSINKRTTIDSIKNQFSLVFPYLKLEFFKKPHYSVTGRLRRYLHDDNTRLSTISTRITPGLITLISQMKVGELESMFETDYGLHVQVFRKSGNVWLETTATDSWTLEQQNEEGRSLQSDLNKKKEDLNDHDIY